MNEQNEHHTQSYFTEMNALQQAVSTRDYEQARRHALEALKHIPGFVDEWLLDSSVFGVNSIPPLEIGGLIFALLDDQGGIEQIKNVAASRDQLTEWQDIYAKHEESRTFFRAIERVVTTQPGVLQRNLKHEVGSTDGRRIATLIGWLEKSGRIRREPSGKTYLLYPPEEPGDSASSEPLNRDPHNPGSHRHGNVPLKWTVDWSTINHIPLPPAPYSWEPIPVDSQEVLQTELFKIVESRDWSILEIEKLAPKERPDIAFRQLYATGSGVLVLDDLGKSSIESPAAALRYGRGGEIDYKGPLVHGIYRVGVSATSDSFIGLSRTHIAHAYDEHLRLIFETNLAKSSEITTLQQRLDIEDEYLHSYIRSITLSNDAERYLFTAVDEAWCIGVDGVGIWGIGMPLHKDDSGLSESEDREALASLGILISTASYPDWIYASAFASNSNRAFVATYSGKVLEVDDSGKPIRYYGIGNVPRRIVDTGDRLYLLTDTRLYVLQNGVLLALIDISAGVSVIVAQTGFGLLEKKRFRWFDENGTPIATVISRDPIRRVYQKAKELIIETRTYRLHVGGANSWWD